MNSTAEEMKRAALQVLRRSGPGAVSMRRIARDTGVTPMAIYHHFRNRAALLDAVVADEFAKLEEAWAQRELTGSLEGKLIAVLLGYVDYALEDPRVFEYVFAEKRTGARRYPADFRARRSPTLNRIADLVRAGVEKGELESVDAWEMALVLWAHVHGFVMLERAGRLALSSREFRSLVRRSARRLIRGFMRR